MANIVDQEAVAIAPAGHVKVVSGSPVVVPERLVEKEITRTAIVGETEGVADNEEAEGLPQRGLPVESFRRTWSGKDRLDGQQVGGGGRDCKSFSGNSEASGKQVDLGGGETRIGGQQERVVVGSLWEARS